MKKKTEKTASAEIPQSFGRVVAAFAGERQVSRARMFSSNAVLNVNGKIFAMHVKGKLVVKLPKQRVDELVRTGKGEYFDPGHGRLMTQWAVVNCPEGEWVELAKEACRFVKAVKP